MDVINSVGISGIVMLKVPCWLIAEGRQCSSELNRELHAGDSSCIADSDADQLWQGCITSVTFHEAILFHILKESIRVNEHYSLRFRITNILLQSTGNTLHTLSRHTR